MDKLKPILAQKFWILLGVALLLPAIGWFLGTGKLAAAIDERVTKLNGLSVPNGSAIPNDDWMKKATVVEGERKERLDSAADVLWDEQQKHMDWPASVQPYVADKKFEDEIDVDGQQRYRNAYEGELAKLIRIVDPLRFNNKTQKYDGKVSLDPSALVTLPPDKSIWQTTPPTPKEIWYLQEEMWLIGGLLGAVRDVNDAAGADSIVKAPIKEITLVQLQGGDMAALEGTGEEGMEEGGMGMDAHGGGMGGMASMMRGAGGGDMGEGAAAGGGAVDFDLAEEVGPNTLVESAEGEDGELSEEDGMGGAHGGGMASMMSRMGGGGGGGAGTPNPLLGEKRYVDDDKAAPFKTRAFKMQVKMDHRQIPEFLAELTNSPFPVRILRVHWTESNTDSRFGGSGPLASGDGGMSGSRGMGGGMGSRGAGGIGSRGMGAPALGSRGMGGMGSRGMSPMMGSRGAGGTGSRGMGAPALGSGGMGSRGMSPMMGSRGAGGMSSRGMGAPALGSRGMGSMGSRGMGAMGSRGMGSRSGLGFPGMDGEGGLGTDMGAMDIYSQAMSNPYLAEVVVGGLMTIYRSPQEVAAGAEGATEGETAEEGTTDGAEVEVDAAATEEMAAEGEAAAEPVAGEEEGVEGAPVDEAAPVEGTTDEAFPSEENAPTDAAAVDGESGAAVGEAAPEVNGTAVDAGEAEASPQP